MKKEKVFIGKNAQGERFYLNLEIRSFTAEATTINHEKVAGYNVLSLSGEVIEAGKRLAYNVGQIQDRLHEITEPGSGLTIAGVARIYKIWEEWHLNDMSSHCAHQDKAIKWDEVAPCSETGYRAGSAWLLKELPEEIAQEITHLLTDIKVKA